MNKPSDIERQVANIEKYAETMSSGLREMNASKQVLIPILRDDETKEAIKKALSGRPAGRVYNHLVPMLGQDQVRRACRLLIDKGEKAASLNNIVRKLEKNGKLLSRIKKRFLSYYEDLYCGLEFPDNIPQEYAEKTRRELAENKVNEKTLDFDRIWAAAQCSAESIRNGHSAERLRTFRDTSYAHLDMLALGSTSGPAYGDKLSFKEVLDFLDCHVPVAFDLAGLISMRNYSNEAFEAVFEYNGRDFWQALAGLPYTQPQD